MEETADTTNPELTTPLLSAPPPQGDDDAVDHDNDGIQTQTIRATRSEEAEILLASRMRQRRWLRCYQRMIIVLSLPPLYFLAVEMTKEHCYFCHHAIDDNSSNLYIIVAAALWGSLMASLYEGCGYWKHHSWCSSIFGGALAASGSLFTMWMLLKSIATNNVVFVFALLVGILGSMPGIMVYYVSKILCDELWKQAATQESITSTTNISIESHAKCPRDRIMSDGTAPEVAEEEEIV